jgi:Sulfotransferase family
VSTSGSPRIKIVYILGSSRCGSTILDATIGTATSVVSTGELGHILWAFDAAQRDGMSVNQSHCSCGLLVTRCPLWSPVWSDLTAKYNRRQFEEDLRKFETIFLSNATAAVAHLVNSRALTRHLNAQAFLLRSIARHSGVTTIVDSSKDPGRAWLYSLLPREDFDVRFIHLVRDGRAVVSSMMNHYSPQDFVAQPSPYPRPVAALFSSAHWTYMNLHASLLGTLDPDRYLLVRYEELVHSPLETLASLESFLGLDLSEPRTRVADGRPLSTGHILCGNRSKVAPTLGMPSAQRDRDTLSRGPALVFLLCAGWLQWYYLRASTRRRLISAVRGDSVGHPG